MSERETPQAIEAHAIAWVARLDRSVDDSATRAELDAWLAADDRHRGAFFRAQAAWAMLDRATVLRGGGLDPCIAATNQETWLSRRTLLLGGGAIAAGIAAAVGIDLLPNPGKHIETALGEIRRVPLDDGSLAAVNTSSRLTIAFEPHLRRVLLDSGEAWFQVAKNPARPFVVEAGNIRVRAVGTAFAVTRGKSGAEVRVTEGQVEVWSAGGTRRVSRVSAGGQVFVSDLNGPLRTFITTGEIDRALAWRTGQLVFDGDTVASAAAEFNRYNRTKLAVTDPELAREKMVGRFRTNEPEAFARATATLLNARVDARGETLVLSRN